MKKIFVLLAILIPCALFGAAANVAVDYNTNVHFYLRNLAVGANFFGVDYSKFKDNTYRFQQAGLRFLRFPGGSNSNEYHWNGNGTYDTDGIWNVKDSPNVTTFSRGFYELAAHRGSSSIGYGKPAMVTDGNQGTYWMSYPDADGNQWIYLDIETPPPGYSPVPVTRIVIDWGDPYAAQYKIQYSNGNWNGMGQWAYNDTAWIDTSQNNVTGAGGQADLSFTQVNAKYVRVYCFASSGAHNQFAIKEIRLYNNTGQITANVNSVTQTPSVSSSVALGDNPQEQDSMDFEEYMDIARSMTPPAEPMITVNFFTGTTQEAADWVYYANIKQKYNVKYWEVGNENWGNWESGGPVCSESYAKRFLAMYDAMIAVDPSIIIVPQFNYITDPENVTMTAGNNDHNPGNFQYYIDNFLKYLQDQGRTGILKGVSIHRYPSYEPTAEATPLAMIDQWNTDMPLLKGTNGWINNRLTNPGEVKVWLTEYNDGIDSGFTDHFYDALFVSGFFMNYLYNGGDQTCFFTSFGTPGPGQNDKTIFSDMGLMEGAGLNGSLMDKRYQPRASFYAFDMIYNYFSADDSLGNTLVSAVVSGNNMLKVYANKRGDRKLSLIFVNIDPSNTITANISLSNFIPLQSADLVSYSRQDYSWVANGTQSYASPDNPPDVSVFNGASTSFSYNVEPYSVKVLTMYDSTRPTFTPSDTPTQLPTPTITPTPLPNGGAMVDDCEHAGIINLWGGAWSTYGDGVSSYPAVFTGMTCDGASGNGSNCYMKVTGTVLSGTWGFGVFCPLNISWAGTDISQYDGIFFYYKGDGGNARVAFTQTDLGGNGNYGRDIAGTASWMYLEIPFSSLTLAAWATDNKPWTGTNVQAIGFQADGGYAPSTAGYREIDIDNVGFYRNTPTPVAIAPDLKHVQAWPSLCNMKSGCKGIKFTNLTKHTILKIFNLNGGMIYKTEQDTPDGTLFWNLDVSKREKKTAPGFYIYNIIDENKGSITGKVAVIR